MINLREDLLFKISIGAIWFSGVMYILIGLGVGALFMVPGVIGGELQEEFGVLFSGIIGGVTAMVGLACAVGNFAVAYGLGRRRRWAWIGAVIIGAIYAPSGCFMIGLLILFAMLRSGVREAFLAECDAAS